MFTLSPRNECTVKKNKTHLRDMKRQTRQKKNYTLSRCSLSPSPSLLEMHNYVQFTWWKCALTFLLETVEGVRCFIHTLVRTRFSFISYPVLDAFRCESAKERTNCLKLLILVAFHFCFNNTHSHTHYTFGICVRSCSKGFLWGFFLMKNLKYKVL